MKVIALTGLVLAEKLDMTVALARHFHEAGQHVTVINNVHYPPLDPARLGDVTLIDLTAHIDGGFGAQLENALGTFSGDMALVAVSEMLPPDDVFTALTDVSIHLPGITMRTLALVDDHTSQ